MPVSYLLHAHGRALLLASICAIALLLLLQVPQQTANAAGNTITVNSTSDVESNGDGLCTLREAITAANTDTVSGAVAGECAAGSGSGTDVIDLTGLTGSITLTRQLPNIFSQMMVNGPGAGTLTIQRNTSTFPVFVVSSALVTISGLSIQGGGNSDGVGIESSGFATLTLADCTVSGFGRGISNSSLRTLTISNCVVSGNNNGGGISNSQGTLNLLNSTVSGNDSHGGFGPGIYNSSATLNVTNSTITGNKGHIAIHNAPDATATFTNSIVSNNLDGGFINNGTLTMTGGSIVGNTNGGIVLGGTANLNGVTVFNNTSNGGAFIGGGGIFINGNAVTVMNCLVANNSTTGNGGGIRNGGGKATLINTTISGNSSVGGGGGVDTVDGGLANFIGINVTITNNRGGFGGGVYRESGPMKFRNSIIAGNFQSNGTSPNDIFGVVDASSSFNLIGTGGAGGLTDGVNNNKVGVADARLGPLANNGGPTQTHSLFSDSPALDAGDNCVTEATHCGEPNLPQLTTDQRGAGFNRIVDGPDADTSATVDIGAYETQIPFASLPNALSTNEDTPLVVPFDAGDTSTITSISASSSNPTLVPNDAAHLNAILAGTTGVVTINPAANLYGTTDITVTVNRTSGSEVKTLAVTVNSSNDVPSFMIGPDLRVNEDAGAQSIANWATNISAGPADENGQTLTFQVTNNSNPGLFSAGPAISATGTLTFTTSPNAYGSADITIVLKDDGGTANGGVDTSPPVTFFIGINPVNDPPTFTKGPDQVVNEDAGEQIVSLWATNISPGAPNESSQLLSFQVVSNTNPALLAANPPFLTVPAITFFGNLIFTPAPNANGTTTITIVLFDTGGSLNGGVPISAPQSFNITVNPVNDPPVNTVPGPQGLTKNTDLIFSAAQSNQISIADVDAGNAAVQVTLTASNGVLTLGGTTGLSFSVGTGTANPTMTFSGTISNINAALNGMRFTPTNNFVGAAQLQIQTNDLGNTGGAPQSDTDAVNITVADSTLQFSASSYAVVEGSDLATITVTRTGSGGAASVNYSAVAGSAFGGGTCGSGADYVNTSGTLSWAAGETTSKTFTVPICNDAANEPDETVFLTLNGVSGAAALGAQRNATLTIADAGPPVLLVEQNTNHAIALDSVTFTRDPFSLTNPFNLSGDHRRRISLFVWRLALRSTDTPSDLIVSAEDDQGRVYPLTVEYVGATELLLVTQVIVRLPDDVTGAPRDLMVTVQLRGSATDKAVIKIVAP